LVDSGATSVLVLSDKSSGSSVFQRELARYPGVALLPWTPHHERESLFWVKAAAALGRPQVTMRDSRVLPYAARDALDGLRVLARRNLPPAAQVEDEALTTGAGLFELWARLVEAHGPVLVEKSPHHLHTWSALELMLEAAERLGERVGFRFVGLVRNPLAVQYSAWRRWRVDPEARQYEWLRAHANLLRLRERLGEALLVVRYEDLVGDPSVMERVASVLGLDAPSGPSELAADRVRRWEHDRAFGFTLDSVVVDVARQLGYAPSELSSRRRLVWPVARVAGLGVRRLRSWASPVVRRLVGAAQEPA